MRRFNLWIALVIFLVLIAGSYQLVSKSLENSLSTPTPTPLGLVFNSPTPTQGQTIDPNQLTVSGQQTGEQPPQVIPEQGSTQPYLKNKYVGSFPGVLRQEVLVNKKAAIETNKGKIEFEIYPEAQKAASNFILLAIGGFYDGLTFHRVESGFVVQGGDPLGNGTGGPGYTFEDEPVIRQYVKGTVAYANAGPNTNGSQFFILLGDFVDLPPKYTIFGKVISGQEVVDKIQPGDKMIKVVIQHLR